MSTLMLISLTRALCFSSLTLFTRRSLCSCTTGSPSRNHSLFSSTSTRPGKPILSCLSTLMTEPWHASGLSTQMKRYNTIFPMPFFFPPRRTFLSQMIFSQACNPYFTQKLIESMVFSACLHCGTLVGAKRRTERRPWKKQTCAWKRQKMSSRIRSSLEERVSDLQISLPISQAFGLEFLRKWLEWNF